MKRILAGPRAVSEALAAHAGDLALVVAEESLAGKSPVRDIVTEANRRKVAVDLVGRDALEALAKGLRHQGVIAVGGDYPYVDLDTLLERTTTTTSPIVVALDEVTDPRNLGAIVRSSVAFGAAGLVVTRDRCATVTPAAVRASAGATEHACIARVTNLARSLETMSEAGMLVIGLDAAGTDDIDAIRPPREGTVLVIGSEGRGLRRLTRERCGTLARIPMAGPIASLNAASAATVALYALARASANLRHDEGQRGIDDGRSDGRGKRGNG